MAKHKVRSSVPLSFEIDEASAVRLEDLRKRLGNCSLSTLVEHAVASCDYASIQSKGSERKQISVRLPVHDRARLEAIAKSERVSMAWLIRHALDALASTPLSGPKLNSLKNAIAQMRSERKTTTTQEEMPTTAAKKTAAKAAKKKVAASKAAVKKAVKKAAAKKAPAKKVATKKVAAKKVAKKTPAKKAVKKVATKKVAVKKAAAKKVAKKK